ncbi:endonuclease/exonuclease/phosphatase family protein [Oleiharenicola sp. Vm1]|uniref:endonuclease/exonuclease/phosphatase family protein n=1 Tax=Oleiharenicola sp. Vm1 TaxID=3398393 RepID=UPI0039F4B9C5
MLSLRLHRYLVLGLLLSVSAAIASALTVGAYNVENYTLADRMVDGVYRKAYPKPEAEKQALRESIRGFAPDILALEEMGGPPFLAELQADLKAAGLDYPHATVLEAADNDRHVAILSKLPFKDVRRHTQVGFKYFGQPDLVKRGVLEVTFATTAGDLTVFVIHLKSKRTERKDDPESTLQRELEATAVRDLVLARFPDPKQAKFIVCGDWNDTRRSKPVRSLLKRGDTELGELLRAYDSRGETWTHFYRAEESYTRIDYLLASPGLLPFVGHKGTAKIHDGPGVREASDHRPVYVELKLAPAP